MSFLDEFAKANMVGGWAEPLLLQLRARRERARQVLMRQAELLSRLESAISESFNTGSSGESAALREWLNDFSEQQMIWQQRQDDNWQRQLAMLDNLAEHMDELSHAVQHDPSGSTASKPTHAPVAPTSNWEQAKQRLLAELESSPETEEPKADDPKAAGKSRRPWQQVIAEKDAEIARLRTQLEEQSLSERTVVLPESVEHDELVLMERENLRRLQAEWQEKLRLAEIEISLERAKLARERQQIDEKLQTTTRDNSTPNSSSPAIDETKAPRSRWMARLGLLDE